MTFNQYGALSMLVLFISTSAQANHTELGAMGGITISKLSNSNEVLTVYPDVMNKYVPNEQTTVGPIAGVGGSYGFDHLANDNVSVTLGLSAYYLNYGDVKGTEYPFINGGSFDTLDYHFKTKSFALMFEPRIVYAKYLFQPYVLGGVGTSWNHMYNYKEKPTDPAGSAAAAPNPFPSKTVNSFAYEVGVGLQYVFKKMEYHTMISLDYRYMNMGSAELAPMPNQLTNDHLEVSNLNTQALVLSVKTVF